MNKEIIDDRKNINKQKESKDIVDMIKNNWRQFLCFYPLKQCLNNIKVVSAENGLKFYTKNLDVINVFQNIATMKKLHDYMLTNKRIFNLSDSNKFIKYYKPVISDDKFDFNLI